MRLKLIVCALVAIVGVTRADADSLVYGNLSNPLNLYVGGMPYEEIADDVVLGPGSRIFESLTISYAGFRFDGDENLSVSLYALDGDPSAASMGFNTPGTVLFSAATPIIESHGTTLTFYDTTGIVLPDQIAIGIAFRGVDFDLGGFGSDAGPLLYHAPTVGASFDDFWLRGFPFPGQEWALFTFDGNPPVNLGAEIMTRDTEPELDAMPEPATLGLLATGLAIIGARRRRSGDAARPQ